MCGAGISVSSGIPDFRSKGGIYSQLDKFNLFKPTDMFDLDFFKRNPLPFYELAKEILPQDRYQPTFTHKFLSRLCQMGKVRRIYSQNVDCLEQKAGIPPQIAVNCHGSFHTASCQVCGHQIQLADYQ